MCRGSCCAWIEVLMPSLRCSCRDCSAQAKIEVTWAPQSQHEHLNLGMSTSILAWAPQSWHEHLNPSIGGRHRMLYFNIQRTEKYSIAICYGDPDILLCIANIMSQRWKDILRQTEIYGGIQTIEWPQNQGGHARLTQPSPSGQFRWLAIAMMKNAKGPDRPFTMRLLYNAPCGRWPIDHGLCRSQTMLNKRQGKPDQDFHCSQKQSITGAG